MDNLLSGEPKPSSQGDIYRDGLQLAAVDHLDLPAGRPGPRSDGLDLVDHVHAIRDLTEDDVRAIEPALWTFTRREGLEPTNNAAEQALRHGVLWRKGSFGTHSTKGSRFVERMLTVHETLRKQKRDVMAYLTAVCQASLHQRPAPSLLPPSTHR